MAVLECKLLDLQKQHPELAITQPDGTELPKPEIAPARAAAPRPARVRVIPARRAAPDFTALHQPPETAVASARRSAMAQALASGSSSHEELVGARGRGASVHLRS